MAVIEKIQWPATVKVVRHEPGQKPEEFLSGGASVVIVHNEGIEALHAGILFLHVRDVESVLGALRKYKVTFYPTPGESGTLRVPITDVSKLAFALRCIAA